MILSGLLSVVAAGCRNGTTVSLSREGKDMHTTHTKWLVALVALAIAGMPAVASEFTMGNFDLAGSRSIADEDDITKKKVEKHGLEVKWTAATDGSVGNSAVTSGNRVMVGDMNGNMYAFDVKDGSLIWQTCVEDSCVVPGFPFAGVVTNPLVSGKNVYVGTLSGSLVALSIKTGEIVWRHTPSVNPMVFGLPLDAVWGGAIAIGDMIVYALSPADQFGLGVYARGAVLAVNRHTGAEQWRSVLISDDDFASGSSGAGFWASAPTYSAELDIIYIGTGQDRNPAPGAVGSDTIFAINATYGTIVWETQVRTTDTWNLALPFDPLQPTDTDFSQSPAVFKVKGRTMVAAGDKRGFFWVMDAQAGTILNNGGAGLDMFDGNLPGPGLTGGFNNDAGFVKTGDDIRHFAAFSDQSAALQDVVNMVPPWTNGTCFSSSEPFCPTIPTGNLVVLKGDGSEEICRYSVPGTEMFSPFHVNGMILVRGAQDGILHILDFDDCSSIDQFPLPTGPSVGASLSIADGLIFTGGGFFGATGLVALGVAK